MDTLSVTTQPSSRKDTAGQDKKGFQYGALWAMYAAYATVVLMPIAALISLYEWARHRNAPFSPYEPRLLAISHYRWLGRTVVLGVIAMMAAAGHFYYGVGILVALVTVVWYFYRIATGVMALIKLEPPPLAELSGAGGGAGRGAGAGPGGAARAAAARAV